MNQNIFLLIQDHLTMLEMAIHASYEVKRIAITEMDDLDRVIFEVENRDRIINIVSNLQEKIEEIVIHAPVNKVNESEINILKSWFIDLQNFSKKIICIDEEIIEILSDQKDEVSKQLAHIFRNKEKFRGYAEQSIKK